MQRSKKTFSKWPLLMTAAALCGCLDTSTQSDSEALTWGPATFPATLMDAYAKTANGVTVTWTEHGGNAITSLQRQTYDLAGNVLGNWQEVKRWTSAGAGAMSYFDPAWPLIRSRFTQPYFAPDTQVGYRVVELPAGFTTCVGTTVGTCGYTDAMAYIPKATDYGVGRVTLSLKTTQAAANTDGTPLHVRAKFASFNETWLDSTRDNFNPGSYLPYDLSTSFVNGLQDIQYIDLWTPDTGGMCVGEVTLTIDGRTAFDQQYSTCVWVKNGSSLHVPFATMRSNYLWQAYAPDTFLRLTPPLTFIGYNSVGLAAHLDSLVGSKMRSATSVAGPHAELGSTTTLTRKDASHMHVQQYLKNLHVVYNQADLGYIDASPSYDLVIHHADATCAGWCVHVEGFDGGASYGSNFSAWALDALDQLRIIITDEVNGALASSFKTSASGLAPPAPFTFCFPDPSVPVSITNPGAGLTITDQGHAVAWDRGSLTVCGAGFNPQN
jgi:hypothetical protein